jgi:hypothetical protein
MTKSVAVQLQHVGDHQFGAFAHEHACRGCAHARCRAGDDDDLARKSHDRLSFFLPSTDCLAAPRFSATEHWAFPEPFEGEAIRGGPRSAPPQFGVVRRLACHAGRNPVGKFSPP